MSMFGDVLATCTGARNGMMGFTLRYVIDADANRVCVCVCETSISGQRDIHRFGSEPVDIKYLTLKWVNQHTHTHTMPSN